MLKKFLQLLMRPGHFMELRAIHLNRGVTGRMFAQNPAEVEQFALKYGRDAEIYMGVAPRIKNGSGGKTNCAAPSVLWVDADNAPTVRGELALFDLEPSITINSGRGLHLYWILSGEVNGDVDRALRQLAFRLEGDVKSAELAHILRVPGTMNHKYTPPRRVEIEQMNLDLRYSLQDILDATVVTVERNSAAFLRGKAWMDELEPAIQGEHGDDATYRAACMLVRDLGLDADEAFELMWDWNQRCVPPWTREELMKKIRSAEMYGTGEKGSGDPEEDFKDLGNAESNITPVEQSGLEKLSGMFKVVNDGGALRIFEKVRDNTLERDVWRRYRHDDFLEVCNSVLQLPLVKVGEKKDKDKTPKMMPLAEYWLDHWRKKKTFNGLVMSPEHSGERTPDNMLNMWSGFALEPKAGSWAMLKNLIFESFCQWDSTSYDYIINWMAVAVQRPWERAGTALVFRGKKGTGKGTLGRVFFKIFGQHGMHFASRELLTGRFNAHLRDCVALFADEAFYAGDKAGEGVLKAFITEPSLVYEEKGKNPGMGRNCLHVIMASNLDWVVPAGMDNERRFAVFDVGDDNHDRHFWNRLYEELNGGGRAAMLYDLIHTDISKFDARQIPQNIALATQKVHGMEPVAAWLLEAAENYWTDFGNTDDENTFLSEDVYASMWRYFKERNTQHKCPNQKSMGFSLRKYMPEGFPKRIRMRKEQKTSYFYIFPDAETSADHIRKMLGLTEDV